MADDSDVEVRFGADASGVEEGAEAAAAAVTDFGAQVEQITAAIEAQTAELTEAFAGLAESIKASMEEAVEAEEKAEEGMFGFLGSIKEGAEAVVEMREAIMGFGEVMLAVFAFDEVKEFIESLGEAGEQVQHTAQAFGMTTGEVQRLQTMFILAGAGADSVAPALTRLNHAMSEAASGNAKASDAFQKLGIDLNEAMTPAERFSEVMEGLSALPGPEKAQVAYELFGRGMVRYAGLIGATKEQLEEWGAATDKFGSANEEAIGKMAALGAALNETKVAMAGVQNVLGDSLSPAFIQIVDAINGTVAAFTASYKAGGLVANIMEEIGEIISIVGTVFQAIGEVIGQVFGDITDKGHIASQAVDLIRFGFRALGDVVVVEGAIIETVFAAIGAGIDILEAVVSAFGKVVADAFSGHWSQIKTDWDAGLSAITARAHAAADEIANTWKEADAKIKTMGIGSGKREESPTAVAGTPQDTRQKKSKDDQVARWQEQLKQIDDLQENWYADQNALAAKFWAGVVASGVGSAKNQQAAYDALQEALKGMDSDATDSAIEAAKKQAEASGVTVAQVHAIYAKLEDQLRADHADTGKDWAKVEQDKADATAKATAKIIAEQTKRFTKQAGDDVKDDERQGKTADLAISGQESQVKDNQQDGVISAQQATAQLLALNAKREDNAKVMALNVMEDEIALQEAIKALNVQGSAAWVAANENEADIYKATRDTIDAAAQESANRRTQIEQAAAKAQADAYKQSIGSIVNTVGSGFLGMARGTETFHQVGLKVAEDLENSFVTSVEKQVTSWLTGEAMKRASAVAGQAAQTAATTAGVTTRAAVEQAGASQSLLTNFETTMKLVTNNAVAAATAAYQAMAGIPIIGPALGAAAAAVTFTAVEGFGALASAAGGYDIGSENPLIQAHAREMVLPASIAEPLRGMIAANSNSPGEGGMGAGSGGGDTHFHFPPGGLDTRTPIRQLQTSSGQRMARQAAQGFRG